MGESSTFVETIVQVSEHREDLLRQFQGSLSDN